MTGRHLIVLVLVAVAAIAAALWTTAVREPGIDVTGAAIGAALMPGLEARLNDVHAIHVYTNDGQPAVSLRRAADSWQVEQKDGYRADNGKIRKLLLDLGAARLLEEKTSNPDYYARIGVQEIGTGANVRIALEGVDTPAIVVGNVENSRQAVYVRRADESTSWLASGAVAVSGDPMQWLDREVIDLPGSRVAEVDIRHADGQRLSLRKESFGQGDYSVLDIPDGRELSRANVANPVGSALASLRYDDVVASDAIEFPDDATQVVFRTFDGLAVEADLANIEDKYYARFRARADAATAARYQPPSDAATDAGDDDGTGTGDAADPAIGGPPPPAALDMAAAEEEAARVGARLQGWVYRLPKYKFEQLTRRMDDLLAAPVDSS